LVNTNYNYAAQFMMNHTRKLVLVPADSMRSQTGFGEPNTSGSDQSEVITDKNISKKRIERDIDKIRKLILIILKIAKHNAYNENFEIFNKDGKVIRDSDIVGLLNNALTYQKNLIGLDRFVEILHEARVDPNWIVNDSIKAKLLAIGGESRKSSNEDIEVDRNSPEHELNVPRITASPPPNVSELNKAIKRKRQIEEPTVPEKRPRTDNWEELSDSDNE